MGLMVSVIVGCNAPEPPPPKPKTVFDPLTQDLDRARAVQTTLDENAEKSREAVRAQENGDATP